MGQATVRTAPFGTTSNGVPVVRYDLAAPDGSGVSVSDFGAAVLEVRAPDRWGRLANVALGFAGLAAYETNAPYLGALVGRCANRIAGAAFEIDGRTRRLSANEGPHHLHGGPGGFHVRPWRATTEVGADGGEAAVVLRRTSPDGEEGYPGTLRATVRIAWTTTHELRIVCEAVTDAPTPVNLVHHGYWNLAGEGSGDVGGHELAVRADAWLPVDASSVPTGDVAAVAGTPFDLRRGRPLGDVLAANHPQLRRADGLDHAFVLRGEEGAAPREAARLTDPRGGRTLRLSTTAPALQVYTGNALDGSVVGRSGRPYGRHAGVALEAQGFPDAVHHERFPSVVLRPGETFRRETVFAFGVDAPAS